MAKGTTRLIKYFTKSALLAANEEAHQSKVSQALKREVIQDMPDSMCVPVFMFHPLNLDRYRVVLVMNADGEVAMLDCLRSIVDRLPVRPVHFPKAA